jgi:protein-ribulosamine 3-kinase
LDSVVNNTSFASTFKITTIVDGKEKLFFVKTANGKDAETMFAGTHPHRSPLSPPFRPFHTRDLTSKIGEHTSLNTIHSAVPTLCPQSYAHGRLSNAHGCFLATDFLNLSPSHSARSGSGISLAHKLAQLHSIPAPTPPGYDAPQFGFPVPTACGDTLQDNGFRASWAEFFADNRLRHVLRVAEGRNGVDAGLARLVERTAGEVVPRLLGEGHLRGGDGGCVVPVVVHGDLWSGNRGRGTVGKGGVEEVVFDPSASWSHSEFEFGIMRMFGGFGAGFEREYHEVKGKDEPVGEWEDRVLLYEL